MICWILSILPSIPIAGDCSKRHARKRANPQWHEISQVRATTSLANEPSRFCKSGGKSDETLVVNGCACQLGNDRLCRKPDDARWELLRRCLLFRGMCSHGLAIHLRQGSTKSPGEYLHRRMRKLRRVPGRLLRRFQLWTWRMSSWPWLRSWWWLRPRRAWARPRARAWSRAWLWPLWFLWWARLWCMCPRCGSDC